MLSVIHTRLFYVVNESSNTYASGRGEREREREREREFRRCMGHGGINMHGKEKEKVLSWLDLIVKPGDEIEKVLHLLLADAPISVGTVGIRVVPPCLPTPKRRKT